MPARSRTHHRRPSIRRPAIRPARPASTFNIAVGATTLGAAGRLLGVDILGTLDLGETTGLVTTLAEPTLTALSGETASFLAGGEFPIPISQSLGTVTIEYKQYGVGLAFTPTVLEDGRISMRVRPEVSELSTEGAIRLNGFDVPALTTRRAETTVELGSGQSFMIGGLLRNSGNNSIDRAPCLGNLPILGALFRSTSFRRNETELVIVVTPYLVRPVIGEPDRAADRRLSATPTTAERVLLGQEQCRPQRRAAPGPDRRAGRAPSRPGVGAIGSAPPPAAPGAARRPAPRRRRRPAAAASAQPGFNF